MAPQNTPVGKLGVNLLKWLTPIAGIALGLAKQIGTIADELGLAISAVTDTSYQNERSSHTCDGRYLLPRWKNGTPAQSPDPGLASWRAFTVAGGGV
jgi:hypothetical protein